MRLKAEPVGCFLIDQTKRMRRLRAILYANGVETVSMLRGGDLFSAAQDGLQAARRSGGACIAAEGEQWAIALALAAQLCVERIVLIAPTDFAKSPETEFEQQIEQLKGFARRNLFFCVSDVLVLEEQTDAQSDRRIDQICRGLCNSRVQRLSLTDQRWTNCEHSPIDAAARFLSEGDFVFSLAK